MRRKHLLLPVALALFLLAGSTAQAQVPNPYLGGTAQNDVNNIISNSLGSIDDTYHGMHDSFNDDIVSKLFRETWKVLQEKVLKPFWQGLLDKDPVCVIVAIVLAGFLLRWGAKIFDSLEGNGQQANAPVGKK